MDRQKVAVIADVSSGIGRATATALVDVGFRVFGTVRDPARLGQELGTVELISMDVRNENSARSAVQSVLERPGRIDLLVNNAGITLIGSAEETSVEEAKQLFETNFFGALRLTQLGSDKSCEARSREESSTLARSWDSSRGPRGNDTYQ